MILPTGPNSFNLYVSLTSTFTVSSAVAGSASKGFWLLLLVDIVRNREVKVLEIGRRNIMPRRTVPSKCIYTMTTRFHKRHSNMMYWLNASKNSYVDGLLLSDSSSTCMLSNIGSTLSHMDTPYHTSLVSLPLNAIVVSLSLTQTFS